MSSLRPAAVSPTRRRIGRLRGGRGVVRVCGGVGPHGGQPHVWQKPHARGRGARQGPPVLEIPVSETHRPAPPARQGTTVIIVRTVLTTRTRKCSSPPVTSPRAPSRPPVKRQPALPRHPRAMGRRGRCTPGPHRRSHDPGRPGRAAAPGAWRSGLAGRGPPGTRERGGSEGSPSHPRQGGEFLPWLTSYPESRWTW